MKKILTKRRRIAFLAIVVAAVVLLGGRLLFAQEAEALEYTEFEVTRGDITVSLSGSGTIAPIAQYEVVSMVGGEVLSDTFEEGDSVEKGQLLYTFDSSEMQNSLERANLSLEKSKMSYENTLESYTGLTVTSPISGKVTELYVNEGDGVNTGTRIAKIVDDSSLTVRIPFSEGDAALLSEGQSVSVVTENTFEVLNGVIEKIYSSNRLTDGYATVVDTDVKVENPGLLSVGTFVTVSAGGLSGYEGGALKGGAEKVVTAQAGGMIEKLHVLVGENVGAGAPLAVLSSETATDSLQEGYLSLREAELSYENTEKQLADYNLTAPISGSVVSKSVKAGDSIETSTKTVMAVIADMSELSFTINIDELDIIKVEAGQQAVVKVDALSGQVFSGVVDNVGILGTSSNGVTTYPVKVRLEQTEGLWPGMNATATIVIDSVSDVLMIPVTAVSRGNLALVKGATATAVTDGIGAGAPAAGIGTDDSKNGFPVGEGDTSAANGSGSVGGAADNAAPVPMETNGPKSPGDTEDADSPGVPGESGGVNIVNNAGEGADSSENVNGGGADAAKGTDQSGAPEGAAYVRIETGLNNDSFIEVKNGLSEGDTVLVVVTQVSELQQNATGMIPGMSGMGGGAPGGAGMPSGNGMPPGGDRPARNAP